MIIYLIIYWGFLDRQSGDFSIGRNKIGYRNTRGGRAHVKTALYMSAMAASKSNGVLGDYYKSLIARGKKPVVALTALMRKIVVIANARLRDMNQQLIT